MKILDKDFTPKYGLRAMFAFEEIAGKAFEVNTLIDTYVFCYACLISNKDNPSLDFNEFIDYCDGHPEVIEEFNEFMAGEMKAREVMQPKKKARKARG